MTTPGQHIRTLERWNAALSWLTVVTTVAFLCAFAAFVYVRAEQLEARRHNDGLAERVSKQDRLIAKQNRELLRMTRLSEHKNNPKP